MQLLSVNNLTKYFGERPLFINVSFNVEDKERFGIVGANGTGKTTMFKILTGKEDYDNGTISFSKNIKLGYMEQHVCSITEKTAYEYVLEVFEPIILIEKELEDISTVLLKNGANDELLLRQHILNEKFVNDGGLTYKNRVKSALKGLGFSENEYDQRADSMSGGQKSKLSLARLLLSNANLLLLDEPTNHLDIDSVEWLEDFLCNYNGAYLVISHDRYFLEKVTNHTLEFENESVNFFAAKYSQYLLVKEEKNAAIEKEYEQKQKEIKRLEGIVEQQRRWNREKNIKTAESKLKVIEKLEEGLVKPQDEEDTIDFSFSCEYPGPNEVLNSHDLSIRFGEKQIFKNVSIELRKGEKVFLIGPNGCGKSSLLKLICGIYQGSGYYKFGNGVKIAYFDQTQSDLDLEKNVLDEVWDSYNLFSRTKIQNALAAFLFKGDDVFKKISTLSGGERARIQLLKLMLSNANLLILDEPTNHLDIGSKEAVENALKSYNGTLLIVSHDRYFINKLAGRLYYLKFDTAQEYKGNYDYYVEKRENTTVQITKNTSSGSEIYRQKKERESTLRKLNNTTEKAEQELSVIGEKIISLQSIINDKEMAADYVKLMEIQKEIDVLKERELSVMELWEKTQNELSEMADEQSNGCEIS